MIPVLIQLDPKTFNALERIADSRGVKMRDLIVGFLMAGLAPEPTRRVVTRQGKPLKVADVNAWVEAASMGVSNRVIAQQWGVSESLVSRELRDRGIWRQKPREAADVA